MRRQRTSVRCPGTITFDGIWTGAEAKSFGAVISAFNKKLSQREGQYKPVGNNIPTVLWHRRSPAGQCRRTWQNIAQTGSRQAVRDHQGKLKPIDYRKWRPYERENFAPRVVATRDVPPATCTPSVFKASNNVAASVYNVPGVQG